MTYRAPVEEMMLTLRHAAGFEEALASGLYGEDLSHDLVEAILGEAGKFAGDVLAPLNRVGDKHGSKLADGAVTTPPGWGEAYKAWCEAGWNALPGPEQWGGQGLPQVVQSACVEMWNSAAFAFALCPLLTAGAIEALVAHGSEELQKTYLAKLVSGEWSGTMNLTEPQAGSDLAALRTKAEPAGDGTYRITGQKIYITYGEHDMTDNIVHLVLARLPDAPAGTRGISLFLVPKYLVNADGTLGEYNDVRCAGVEHKLGIHASPTCTMVYGDKGGAKGWLIGEENRGLACMFTMMNAARLGVGLQGVAIAERATQQALSYARERRQGRAAGANGEMSPIVTHPDVQRMLLTMKAMTAAARAICYRTAAAIDRSKLAADPDERRRAHEEASLLTPVAKAFSTDIGVEVASLGVQVHGGMGYVEETGAAQHLRDARIAPIYEGTNGIQAIDLVTRKLPLSDGATVRAAIARARATAAQVLAARRDDLGETAARLRDGAEALDRATSFLLKALSGNSPDDALAAATPYLRLFGLVEGGGALAATALAEPASAAPAVLCRFFAEQMLPAAGGLEASVISGGASFTGAQAALS